MAQVARREFLNLICLRPYHLSPDLCAWIDEFEPQVIYTVLAENNLMRLVATLSRRWGIPVVPHLVDDWPTTGYRDSALALLHRVAMRQRLGQVLRQAPVRLAISQAMATEFERRYGPPFFAFMNSVDAAPFAQGLASPPARSEVRLMYAGGLHLGRWRSLREIANALRRLDAEGTAVRAEVYTNAANAAAYGELLTVPPVMRVVGALPHDQMPARLCDADCLIHVESFERGARAFTRYSVSTKIPEYLAAGRPILAYGPGEVASIAYVRQTGVGIAVGQRGEDALVDALCQLCTSSELRHRLGLRGRELFQARHEAEGQREAFRALLARVAEHRAAEHRAADDRSCVG